MNKLRMSQPNKEVAANQSRLASTNKETKKNKLNKGKIACMSIIIAFSAAWLWWIINTGIHNNHDWDLISIGLVILFIINTIVIISFWYVYVKPYGIWEKK